MEEGAHLPRILLKDGFKTVGVAGAHGKSTVTALIGHILNESGIKAIALHDGADVDPETVPAGTVIVSEIFVEDIAGHPDFHPDISVLLNFGLNTHRNDVRVKILNGAGQAVIGIDSDDAQKFFEKNAKESSRILTPVSSLREAKGGVYVRDGKLIDARDGDADEIADLHLLPVLRGSHNQRNLAAAYTVCRMLGLDAKTILSHIKTWPGLPHRQMMVRAINGVAYVDDSMATDAQSTSEALAAFTNIYLIAGGKPDEHGLEGIQYNIDNVRHAYLIGEAAEDFAKWFEKQGIAASVCETIDIAILDAHAAAQGNRGEPGGAAHVLFSPACKPGAQFEHAQVRGKIFADIVASLSEEVQ